LTWIKTPLSDERSVVSKEAAMKTSRILAAATLALLAFSVSAQQMKTVRGIVVNIGIVNAIDAEHSDAQHGVHKGGHGAGMEHVVIALAEAKGGARIADAEVAIELRDPKGVLQKKPLVPMVTAGFPDYSEVFYFGWSGKYNLRVTIKRKGAAKPVDADFVVNRVL
jgi:hypothetical protein